MRRIFVTTLFLVPLLLTAPWPAAGQQKLQVTATGVGIGTNNPNTHLHVVDPDPGGNAAIVQDGALLVRRGDGSANIRFSTPVRNYLFQNNPNNETFGIRDETAGNTPFVIFGGNAGARTLVIRNGRWGLGVSNPSHPIDTNTEAHLTSGGQWTNASSREFKTDFASLDGEQILAALATLPIQSWRYRDAASDGRHVGPTAEDFQAAFGLGDGRTIPTGDADGIALAAIQALHETVAELRNENKVLRQQLIDVTARLDGEEGTN